jgi:hypothetical protein
MDPAQVTKARAQQGFIANILLPIYEALRLILPAIDKRMFIIIIRPSFYYFIMLYG